MEVISIILALACAINAVAVYLLARRVRVLELALAARSMPVAYGLRRVK
jgi:hypothetical protein